MALPLRVRREMANDKFYGIAIATCCAHSSTGGKNQYQAYCNHVGTGMDLKSAGSERVAVIHGIEKASYEVRAFFITYAI